jgi:hypothetical protein
MVDAIQPFHGGNVAHTSQPEILRWLSNVDKHRQVHRIGRTAADMGAIALRSEAPIEIVHNWRHQGEVKDGSVMGRLKFRRPETAQAVDLVPVFAFEPSIQISDKPVEYRPLVSLMEAIRSEVLTSLRPWRTC